MNQNIDISDKKFEQLAEEQKTVIKLFKQFVSKLDKDNLKFNNQYYVFDYHCGSVKSLFDSACLLHGLSYDQKAKLLQMAEEAKYWIKD